MNAKTRAASLVLLLAAISPSRLLARDAVLEVDGKLPPPALCLQQLMGLRDRAGRMNAIGGIALETRDETEWASRARRLGNGASSSDWRRLENAWARYVALRDRAAAAMDRVCTGEQIAQSAGTDIGYAVLAPVEILGAFFPDANGNASPSEAFLPVVGAIGLATDPVFAAALPVAKARKKFRERRAAAAFGRFKALVAEGERSVDR